jgi:hypothetical protein
MSFICSDTVCSQLAELSDQVGVVADRQLTTWQVQPSGAGMRLPTGVGLNCFNADMASGNLFFRWVDAPSVAANTSTRLLHDVGQYFVPRLGPSVNVTSLECASTSPLPRDRTDTMHSSSR